MVGIEFWWMAQKQKAFYFLHMHIFVSQVHNLCILHVCIRRCTLIHTHAYDNGKYEHVEPPPQLYSLTPIILAHRQTNKSTDIQTDRYNGKRDGTWTLLLCTYNTYMHTLLYPNYEIETINQMSSETFIEFQTDVAYSFHHRRTLSLPPPLSNSF